MRRIIIAGFLSCACLAAPCAMAAKTEAKTTEKPPSPSRPLDLGGDGPIEISASKSLEWRQEEHKYIARGEAVATRGNVTINAEELAAFERGDTGKTEIYKLTATKNVKITADQHQVYGDEGFYDADQRLAVLTGKDLRFISTDATVTAKDALEYWQDKREAVARGHAVAIRDKRRIEADAMTAQFGEGKDGAMELKQLTATGNVIITTESDIARGSKAVYDMKRNVAVLSGNVRVTRGASQLNGSVAEVDFKTGISRMTTSGKGSGRVRALFVPGAASPGETATIFPPKP